MGDLPAPSPTAIAVASRLISPWRFFTSPDFHGMEHIPREGPVLLVGNHTVFGLLDAPFMVLGVYEHTGRILQGLGDHAHFKVPGWRKMLGDLGVVDGTRENCSRLMEAGRALLVFPGGAREVAKRRGEAYQLFWGQRLGFARMAIAHACPIVPFAAVGVEDAVDIVLDADDLLAGPVGPVLRKLGIREDLLFPVLRGLGPTPVPRPERLYFRFGAPIDPHRFGSDAADTGAAGALRDAVRVEVEGAIETLREVRARDPYREMMPRLRRAAGRVTGTGPASSD